MLKYIYKITNLINQKSYIGQTTDPNRRFKEHQNLGGVNEENAKILYRAIKKYGIENFSFEIIEGPIEDYNEKEIYWIAYYNTYIKNENAWGYNMTPGGEEPPHFKGEEHHYATHTFEDIEKIIYLLKDTNLSIKEIANTFHYHRGSIERINTGKLWNLDDIDYPIRKETTKDFKKERAAHIKEDLLYTNLTQKEIGEKYGVGRTTITAINNGQNYFDDTLDYPLRKVNQQSKPILMIDIKTKEILKEFPNAVEAMHYLGDIGSVSSIRYCASGVTKTSFGYIWAYKEK